MSIILEPHTFELFKAEYTSEWSLSVPHSTPSFYSNSILNNRTETDTVCVKVTLLSDERRLSADVSGGMFFLVFFFFFK